MSGGETSLSGTDNNSLALKYTPGYESVFINGVLQVRGSDYVATTGTTVTGLTALTASDVVMVESIVAYSVGDTYTQSQISSLLDAKSPVSTTGLVLISTSTFSAVSSVSLDNVFSAAYENYKILVSMTGTTSQQANIRFRVGGVDASGANYNYGRVAVVASAIAGSTSTSQSEGGVGNFANAERSFITMDVFNPFLAVNTQYASSSNQRQQSNFAVYNYSGSHNVDTSYTGFTLSAATGNITGTIKVYGYKQEIDVTRARDVATQGGLVLISSTTIGSAVSSVVVSNAFSATYDNYKIFITGGVQSTEGSITLKMGSTTTGYYAGRLRILYASGTLSQETDNNAALWSNMGYGNTTTLTSNFELLNPFKTQQTTMTNISPEFGTNTRATFTTGFLNNSTSYTDFTIATAGGSTITGGTISVYGYKK